jgi:hypothetical protein
MTDFRLGVVPSSSVLHVYSLRDSVWFDPPYQRMGDVWPTEKRQLLIDSILNGYDIPKLYFHEFFPSRKMDSRIFKYAIVDGKQRLRSIFSYIEGAFSLASDMEYIADPTIQPGGLTYAELARRYPELKTRFDGFVLPIVSILTEDTELIEDMFSRLNEAIPLNAPEKRNALGGPIPPIIRKLSKERFFSRKLPFDNRRYRHFDLATKFLYINEKRNLVDTKKVYLDEFVRAHKNDPVDRTAKQLASRAEKVLDSMAQVFIDQDFLLRSVGTVVLYYFLFFDARENDWINDIERTALEAFENKRAQNRALAEKSVAKADYRLLEYDRLVQSPNDSIAMRYRYAVLRHFVGPKKGRPSLPEDN